MGASTLRYGVQLDSLPFKAVFDRTLIPMLLADDSRRYVDANQATCLLLRQPRERVLEQRVEDLTPPELRAQVAKAWETFVASGSQAGRWELQLPDGQTVTVDYSATANVAPGLHLSVLIPRGIVPEDGNDGAIAAGVSEPLSPREREVLSLIALGRTGGQIAGELTISAETVQKHVHNAKRKLGASTRAHAIVLALKTGQIDLEAA